MSSVPFLAAGSYLGRYRLVERLGAGGMGEVWRASDTALARDVALKVLRVETLATPERRVRFQHEARTAATVSHPNIVPVYDVGEAEGVPYIVQELVAGKTLAQVLESEGPVPAERAADWGAQAADGLAAAHAAGVIHRDVKPGNLIIGADGRVRVLDFGLAKLLEAPGRRLALDSITTDGLVVGTVHYMSPEQALGRELDARSDVFSLGTVLYEAVTGKRPFDGPSAVDTMHAIAYGAPRALAEADPAIPPGFLAVLEKALEKSPDDRYGSLSEMAIDLRRFLRRSSAGSATLAAPGLRHASAPTRPFPALSRRRGRRLGLAAAAVLAGSALVLFGARIWGRRLPRAVPPAATRFLVQTESCEEAPVFSPDGRAFAYASNARGDYDVYYRLVAGSVPVRLTDSPDDEREPVFSPDGASIYYARGDIYGPRSSIWAVPTLGGPTRRILESGDTPTFSGDGRLLLFRRYTSGRTALWLADPDGGHARELFAPPTGAVSGPALSPDGKWAAFAWNENAIGAIGDVWKIATSGGAPQRLTHDRRDVWGRAAWLPDGSAVLFASVRTGTANIWMVPARGGDPVPVTTGSGWVHTPSVSPDARSLLLQNEKTVSEAWEYSLPEGRGRQLTQGGGIWAPLRLPDGRLLYGDWSRQEEEIDLYVQDASGAKTYLTEGSSPRVSPDGRTVYFSTASGGGRRCLARVDVEGGPPHRLTDPAGTDEYPDPTPDGRSVLFCRALASGQRALMVLPLAAGASPRSLFSGEALASRAGADAAVFTTCDAPEGCGVYAVPYAGGEPRLLVPEGRWPALGGAEGRTVYAITGPKSAPELVRVPLAGGREPERLFAFNPARDPRFWAVFTLDVGRDERSVVVTQQKNDADVVLLSEVFR